MGRGLKSIWTTPRTYRLFEKRSSSATRLTTSLTPSVWGKRSVSGEQIRCSVADWIFHGVLREALEAQQTGVARSARFSLRRWIVAGPSQTIVQTQCNTRRYDLSLGHRDQRCVNSNDLFALDRRLGRQVRHRLESV